MNIAIIVLLTFLCLVSVAGVVLLSLLYRPLRAFLTWNTRYNSHDYESAVTSVKTNKPAGKPAILSQKGRAVKQTDELISLEDMPFEDGYAALERAANGS